MVPIDGLCATLSACKYAVQNNIAGDFVECGVWRGGNALIAASVFKRYNSCKKVYLFDTFEGFDNITTTDKDNLIADMSNVSDEIRTDEDLQVLMAKLYDTAQNRNSLNAVRTTFEKCGLLDDNIVFVKGDVLETLNSCTLPSEICVLRLDTDLYESTKFELESLYPRLSIEGVLMLDDYGFHEGSRLAVEDYFSENKKPLLQVIGSTNGRLAIKT